MKTKNKLTKSIFSVALASTLAIGATPALLKNFKNDKYSKADELISANVQNKIENDASNFGFETYVNNTTELQGWTKSGSAIGGYLPISTTEEAKTQFNDFEYAKTAYGTDIENPDTPNIDAGLSVLYIDSNGENTFCTYTSNDITLSPYSFYKISVYAKTNADDTKATFSLGKDLEDTGTVINITQTTSDWTQYSIYVATGYGSGDSGKIKTNIALSLGTSETSTSTGHVFFDEVSITQIFEADYTSATGTKKDFSGLIDNSSNTINNFSSDADFNSTGWTLEQFTEGDQDDYHTLVDETDTTGYIDTFDGSENKILQLDNSTSSAMTYKSKKFEIERFGYYRLSFFSRDDYKNSNRTSASFNVTLNATLNGNTKSTTLETIKPYDKEFENPTPASVNNLWHETIYYIKGCPLYDVDNAWLSITIPANTKMYFDNFTLLKVGYNEYSTASNTKFELTSTLPSNSFTNGLFNLTGKSDNEKLNNLLPAQNWTFNATITRDVYTVQHKEGTSWNFVENLFETSLSIDTDTITYNTNTYTQSQNDGETNVFYNGDNDRIKLTKDVVFTYSPSQNKFVSNNFTNISIYEDGFVDTDKMQYGIDDNGEFSETDLYPNKLVIKDSTASPEDYKATYTSDKFTAKSGYSKLTLNAKNSSSNACKILLLDADKKVLSTLNVSGGQSDFSTYSFYINSTSSAKILYLQFVYTYENAGTDNSLEIKQVTYKSSNQTLFEEAQKQEQDNFAILDFTKPNFAQLGEEIEAGKFEATNISVADKSTGEAYIARTGESGNYSYQLTIDNADDPTMSTTITTDNYTLTKSKFYKLIVKANTDALSDGKSARLTIAGTDVSFDITETEPTEYTLFIATGNEDITTNFTISLLESKGSVIIDEISLTESNKTEFEETLDEIDETSLTLKATDLRPQEEDDGVQEITPGTQNTTPKATKNKTLEILFATLSTLLLVAALVFAIVFTKVNAKRKNNKSNRNSNKVAPEKEPHGFV